MTIRKTNGLMMKQVMPKSTPKPQGTPQKIELSGGDEGKQKEWLIIYYGAADNNLTDYLYADLNEVEKVGSDENTHIVALFDAGEGYSYPWNTGKVKDEPISTPCPFKGAKVFYLKKDSDPNKINSPQLADLGQVDTADPKFMAEFISKVMEKYPAKHVAVIISDHGGGWHGAVDDDSAHHFMSLKEIKQAMDTVYQKTGRKIDIVGWDACLMAMGEVGYALRGAANIMVASQQTEGGDGWPYPAIFRTAMKNAILKIQTALKKRLDVSPEEFAKMIVESGQTSSAIRTLSAMDLRKADEFAKKVDDLALAILNTDVSQDTIRKIMNSSESFYYSSFKDIFDFARRLAESKEITDKNLKEKAKSLYDFRKQFVIANYHDTSYHPNAYGVSLEMSTSPSSTYRNEVDFAKDTHWDEALSRS